MNADSTIPLAGRQILALLSDLVGQAANAAIELDPAASARVRALEEQNLRFEIELPSAGFAANATSGPVLTFTVTFAAGRLRLRHHTDPVDAPAAHAIVSGSASALLSFLAPGRSAALPKGLKISGDVALVEALKTLASGYSPDLGIPLGQLLGPRAAAGVLDAFELAQAGLRTALQMGADLAGDAARRVFADRPLTAVFLDELDELRLLVDRAEARVERVERDHSSP